MTSATEAIGGAVAGGALGALAALPTGLAAVGAVIGAANGAISGAREVYDWSTGPGKLAFVLDSTWALPTTAAGVLAHALGALRGRPAFVRELSHRQNRHVYGRGFQLRPGFATTFGNVITGAAAPVAAASKTVGVRSRLITDHENVHVWQSRWFGPLFPVFYGGWLVGGVFAGCFAWLAGSRSASLARTIETWSYYLNPFEYWAYSRDGSWPPRAMLGGVGPRRPMVSPFRGADVESLARSVGKRLSRRVR